MLMSGQIQRALIKIFDRERDNASRPRTCASGSRIFVQTRSRRVTAAPSFERCATSLRSDRKSNGSIARGSAARSWTSCHDEVLSYGIARLKADRFQRYRGQRSHWSSGEEALRRVLDDESYRKLIGPGGAWRRQVEIFLARRGQA